MKQSKLRRKRVFRYAVLYFLLFVVFVGLIAGPIVVGKQDVIPSSLTTMLSGESLKLLQPTDLEWNDTLGSQATGTDSPSYSGEWTPSGQGAERTADRIRLF